MNRFGKLIALFVFALLVSSSRAFAQIPEPGYNIPGALGCQGFPCLNSGTLPFTSDADHVMTDLETSAFFIRATSTVPLTATRKLIYPSSGFNVVVENATTGGQAISICGPNGACANIPNDPNHFTQVWSDGTNFITGSYSTIFSGSSPGLVPSSPGGTSEFLRADGQWQQPPEASIPFPPAGIANSTGTAWGNSYALSGNGSYVVLSDTPNITSPNILGNASINTIIMNSNSGLPAQINNGAMWIAGGFDNAISGKFYIGDGTGWKVAFARRIASQDTDLLTIQDNGNMNLLGNFSATSVNGVGITKTGSGSNFLADDGTYKAISAPSAAPLTNPAGGQNNYAPIASPTFTGPVNVTGSLTATGSIISNFGMTVAGNVSAVTMGVSGTGSNQGLTVSGILDVGGNSTLNNVAANTYRFFTASSGALCNGSTGFAVSSQSDCPNTNETIDISFPYIATLPADGSTVMESHIVTRTTICPIQNMVGEAFAGTAPTGTTIVTINRVVGTVPTLMANLFFNAGSNIGQFNPSGGGNLTLNPGDMIQLVSPSTNLFGLAGVSVTIQCMIPH